MTEDRAAAVPMEADGGIDFGPLPRMLGYQIRQAQAAVFRDFGAVMGDLKISPGEFGMLSLIHANPGTNQARLATAYKLDKSTLSLAVASLVKRGLVRRARSKVDQRYFALWLSDAGEALLRRANECVAAQERAMDAVLRPGEREQLLDMLTRVARALDR